MRASTNRLLAVIGRVAATMGGPFLKTALLIVTVLTVVGCVILILWWVPKYQVVSLKGVDPKDIFAAENSARPTLAQILGGAAILIGLYFAWKNVTATSASLELTNKNLELNTEGQITERFTRAIEQLGASDAN